MINVIREFAKYYQHANNLTVLFKKTHGRVPKKEMIKNCHSSLKSSYAIYEK